MSEFVKKFRKTKNDNILFLFRLLSSTGYQTIMEVYRDDKPPPPHEIYRNLYMLESHRDKRTCKWKFIQDIAAVTVLKYLIVADFFPKSCSANLENTEETRFESFVDIVEVIQRHIDQRYCNGFRNREYLFNNNSVQSKAVAYSMYIRTSLFNHSCDPNAAYAFIGDKIVMRALRPITKSEEINITYLGDDYLSCAKDKRQSYLLENYFFECNCGACANDWPELVEKFNFNHELTNCKFKCENCQIKDNIEDNTLKCDCKNLSKKYCDILANYFKSDQQPNLKNIKELLKLNSHVSSIISLMETRPNNMYDTSVNNLRKIYGALASINSVKL